MRPNLTTKLSEESYAALQGHLSFLRKESGENITMCAWVRDLIEAYLAGRIVVVNK